MDFLGHQRSSPGGRRGLIGWGVGRDPDRTGLDWTRPGNEVHRLNGCSVKLLVALREKDVKESCTSFFSQYLEQTCGQDLGFEKTKSDEPR